MIGHCRPPVNTANSFDLFLDRQTVFDASQLVNLIRMAFEKVVTVGQSTVIYVRYRLNHTPFSPLLTTLPKKESRLCHYLVVNFPCLQVESCDSKRSTRQVSSIRLRPRSRFSYFSWSFSFILLIFLFCFLSYPHSFSFYLFSIHLFTLLTHYCWDNCIHILFFLKLFFFSFYSIADELVHCVMFGF